MSQKHSRDRNTGAEGITDFEIEQARQRFAWAAVHPDRVYCWREVYNRIDSGCRSCEHRNIRCRNLKENEASDEHGE